MSDALFAPVGDGWKSLAPSYVTSRRIGVVVSYLILIAIAAVPLVIFELWVWLGVAVVAGLALLSYRFWRMRVLVASYAYAEQEHELAITRGLMWRTYTVVPYGRMQLVEVNSGPIDRVLGLATVKLVTASAQTDAEIPGLAPEEAARLRDKLTALGESQSAGL